MEYESNDKHSAPCQRGRRGSLCPREARDIAAELLDGSELVESRRYAVNDAKAYCAQEHRPGVWHGYPVGWKEVSASTQRPVAKAEARQKSGHQAKLGLNSATHWERLAGDTSAFAIKIAFMDDPG